MFSIYNSLAQKYVTDKQFFEEIEPSFFYKGKTLVFQ